MALNNELEEFLEDNNNLKVFSELIRKRPNSEAEIMAVCKACTLKNKSNETNIDLSMIRKAFSLINMSVGSTDIHEVIRTLKSSVLIDNDGNEYYSPKLFNFAKDFPKHYMSVITVNKNKSEVFDSVSEKEFQKLYNLYGDDDLAAEILNACKLTKEDGNKILDANLLKVLSHLQNMKKVSQWHIPDIINLLKSHKRNNVEEFIVLQKLRYVVNSTDKSGEQLLYKLEKR